MTTTLRAIRIAETDNVATLVQPVTAGDSVQVSGAGEEVTIAVTDDAPMGHKIALEPLAEGQPVIKYGECIGRATCGIDAGGHVHVHNVRGVRGRKDKQ